MSVSTISGLAQNRNTAAPQHKFFFGEGAMSHPGLNSPNSVTVTPRAGVHVSPSNAQSLTVIEQIDLAVQTHVFERRQTKSSLSTDWHAATKDVCAVWRMNCFLRTVLLTSHQTQYRSYRRRVFMGQMTQPTVSKH